MDFLIELNSKFFFENIKNIKKITTCQLAPVIKSNAYGHGTKEIINLLKQINDIEYVCVAHYFEALQAKNFGWDKKIIIMSPVFDEVLFNNDTFEYFLTSFDLLFFLLKKSKKNIFFTY
jgi:alanine racemase